MTPPKSPASASPRATRVPGSTTTAPEESRAAGAELTQPLVELEDGEIARDASSHGEASDSDTDDEGEADGEGGLDLANEMDEFLNLIKFTLGEV